MMNFFHDQLVLLSRQAGWHFNDKQLHFLVIGLLGIILFIVVHRFFKYLVRHSLTAISFIYTLTVLVVLVFAIEIGQKLTGRGNMEFQDIVEGIWGFLVAFAVYLGLVIIVRYLKKFFGFQSRSRK
jgi:FtsH-binding integral membrane protein